MKLEALEFANQYGDADAAFAFNTTRKSIRDWRKKESELKKLVGDGLNKRKRLHGGGRPIKHPELELLLLSSKKGNAILRDLGKEETLKYGCIWRMKDRNGLSIRRKSTEHQYEPGDLIPKVQRFYLFMKDLYEKHYLPKLLQWMKHHCLLITWVRPP